MGGGGGGAPPVDYTAENRYAAINKDIYNQYKSTYTPVENAMMATTTPEAISADISRAGRTATQAQQTAIGASQRNFSRYGINPNSQTIGDIAHRDQVTGAALEAGSKNRERTAATTAALETKMGVVALGQGNETNAQNMFGNAAQEEARVNMANEQIAAQNAAASAGVFGTALGIGASFIPW